jgi:hypothetical protein
LQLIIGVLLQVQDGDLTKFASPQGRVAIAECVRRHGGAVHDVTIRAEASSVDLVLSFDEPAAADLGPLVADLATALALGNFHWVPFNPAPDTAVRLSGLRGLRGRGTKCDICQGLDGHHDPGCPNRAG